MLWVLLIAGILMTILTFITAFIGQPVAATCMGAIMIICLTITYFEWTQRKQTEENEMSKILHNLVKADKSKSFSWHIERFTREILSINIKEEFFKQSDPESSVWKSYELIKNKIISNIESATVYIKQYDFVLMPDKDYVDKKVKENEKLVKKLSELSDLVIQIQDSTSEVDDSFADDMLNALKRMVEESEK